MTAYRFINLLMSIAALAASAFAAYVFFGRSELDQAELQRQNFDSKIAIQLPFAEGGDAQAQYRLGRLYRYGLPGEENLSQTQRWLKAAAGSGHSGAQYELGKMHAIGLGVGRSYYRAAEWYEIAARVGRHRSAEFALGELYFTGRGVNRDYVDAHRWLMKAGRRGHPLAQYYLGEIYEKGWGVNVDIVAAYRWYSLASRKAEEVTKGIARGDPKRALSKLKTRMNKSQLSAGEKLIKAWKPIK